MILVLMHELSKARLELQVLQVLLDHQADLEVQDLMVHRADQEMQVELAVLDHLVNLVYLDLEEM